MCLRHSTDVARHPRSRNPLRVLLATFAAARRATARAPTLAFSSAELLYSMRLY